MTSYINQTIARQHVAEMIDAAANRRLRREIRQARRQYRRARREALGFARWTTQSTSSTASSRSQHGGAAFAR